MRVSSSSWRTARRVAFACLPLCGLAELGAHLWFRASAPAMQDWAALVAPVRELRKKGEVIVVTPRWAEPLARQSLGAELFPLAQVARADSERYPGAVEISILGAVSDETGSWIEEERRQVGQFTVRRLRNPSARPTRVDFVDRLPTAQVTFGQPATPCSWNPRARVAAGGLGGHPTFPGERFECGGSMFFNVGVTAIADEEFVPRRCIWAHPPAAGDLRIGFPAVDLGDEIVGHGGLYWMVERPRTGAPIHLTIRVDGDTVGEVVHRDGEGWAPFAVPLGSHAGQTGALVEFAVSSPDHRHRHFCFEAISR